MSLVEEFKKFALRGNMLDLAVGFTVGAAFTTVVKSLVEDIIMPPIGLITGRAAFSDQFISLQTPDGVQVPPGGFSTPTQATQAGVVTLNYGEFINACFSFLVIAIAMFLIIRGINRLDRELDEAFGEPEKADDEPTEKKCEYCRTTIAYRATRCPNCTSDLRSDHSAAPVTTS